MHATKAIVPQLNLNTSKTFRDDNLTLFHGFFRSFVCCTTPLTYHPDAWYDHLVTTGGKLQLGSAGWTSIEWGLKDEKDHGC